MAKKSKSTFQKREKERARQQKQKDKEQRRLESKARRADSVPRLEGGEPPSAGMHLGPQALPPPWE